METFLFLRGIRHGLQTGCRWRDVGRGVRRSVCCGPGMRADARASGVWLTQQGDAKVRVSKCGGGICGVIIWLREPMDSATGKPATDNKNPNPSLASRPMIGLPLFSGMQPSGPNRWSGQIYNADDGNMYASHISLVGAEQLKVEGCVGALCGGETWTRAR